MRRQSGLKLKKLAGSFICNARFVRGCLFRVFDKRFIAPALGLSAGGLHLAKASAGDFHADRHEFGDYDSGYHTSYHARFVDRFVFERQ